MNRPDRLKRLRFRASHRGIREADLLIGSFFDRHHDGWDDDGIAWFERLLEEQDVDILAWAMGSAEVPGEFRGTMMNQLKNLNYIKHPK
ncbi:MAG: FAD assembly factor SdhE [Allosphingosinicella sp.]